MGSVARRGDLIGSAVADPHGCRLEVVYCAVADALPGLHAGAFAPANWPEDELELAGEDNRSCRIR